MSLIEVKSLNRVYKIFEKENGLRGTISSLIKRKWKIVHAVKEINFSIEEGETVGFLGPNGAGKTTTLKMLAGILLPTSGSCKVMGYIPHQRKKEFSRSIALVMGQKSQLIWELPALDSFNLHAAIYQIEKNDLKKRCQELGEMLNVTEIFKRPVRQLSLGERMKCELVLSLLHKPKVLFLDEPTIGMDVISQKAMWIFLKEYQLVNKTTILLTSHYMQDIINLCKRAIIINNGIKIFDGSLENLVKTVEPKKEVIIQFESNNWKKNLLGNIFQKQNISFHDEKTIKIVVEKKDFYKVKELLIKFDIEQISIKEMDLTELMQKSFFLGSDNQIGNEI